MVRTGSGTSTAKSFFGRPRAGESGVGSNVGPIYIWGLILGLPLPGSQTLLDPHRVTELDSAP
jgi:hypothetical protein